MRSIAWLLFLGGCPKPTVPQVEPGLPMHFGAVLQTSEGAVLAPDEGTLSDVEEALTRRNFAVRNETVEGPPNGRLERLMARSDGALVLLVESRPRFSSQMNGRYRWTVDVKATLVEDEMPVDRVDFTVPVHLLYAHERDQDALLAAAPSIARRVGGLVDGWIAGRAL